MKRYRTIMALFTVMALLLSFTPGLWAQEAQKVNINQADATQIAALKGIGPKYAERIIAFRDQNGPFKAPEDIVKVQGIGLKTFEANKDRIIVEDE